MGAFTCYTPRGSSVVDYFVASNHFFESIFDLSIGDLTVYSDHCPIILDIVTRREVQPTVIYERNRAESKSSHRNDQATLLRTTTRWNISLEQEIRYCLL